MRVVLDGASLTIEQVHALEATDTIIGAPVLGTPTIEQTHALEASSVVAGAPALGLPIASDGGLSEYFTCDSDIVTSLGLSSDMLELLELSSDMRALLDLSSNIVTTKALTSAIDLEDL